MKEKYAHILSEYPAVITLNQLYKICHISKRKGKWLLENNVIPCKKTDKKTRRFKIKTTDVVDFLIKRDSGLLDESIPVGIFSSGCNREVAPAFSINKEDFKNYLTEHWAEQDDMLTVKQVVILSGYRAKTIYNWLAKDDVKTVIYRGTNLLFKDSLIDFMAYNETISNYNKSEMHMELVENCLSWQGDSVVVMTQTM